MNETTESSYDVKAIRDQIRKVRHNAELPLRVLSYLITTCIYILSSVYGYTLWAHPEVYQTSKDLMGNSAEEDGWIIDVVNVLGPASCIALFLAALLLILFAMYKQYADEMSYAIKVTEKNFPEIHAKAVEFSEKLGLKKVPEVYIQQKNGQLNAFSIMVPKRKYVQLNAEMVDIAYMEHHDFDTLAFVMAHEFGHIYLGHVEILHHVFSIISRLIPVFNVLVERSMEYSADRVAQVITDDQGAADCMMLLSAGRHLYKYADKDDYLASVHEKHSFLERLGRFVTNLLADHPINAFRVEALLDPERKSGRLI